MLGSGARSSASPPTPAGAPLASRTNAARLGERARRRLAGAAPGWAAVAVTACAAATIVSARANGCDDDDEDGLDVGVVFSGGGALASSHVGALAVIEEAGVPVHCVVGTSMGAIVAALYAAGHDAEDLGEIFVNADWSLISTGEESYRARGFRTKENERDFFTDYVLGVTEEGLKLPPGLSSLRGMRSYLRYWTSDVAGEGDFDDLPVAFRAVATDLGTGDAVTIARGDLVDAALASMAVPGLYPSQIYDGRVLIDGGMSKQMPVDVARDMGADVVIAIDTTLPPSTAADRVPSLVETVMRLVNVEVWRNWLDQVQLLTDEDIHIRPDITGQSTYLFDQMNEGYEVGRAAALEQLDRLEALAARAAPPRPKARPEQGTIVISSVSVGEASNFSEGVILERLDVEPGDAVTAEELQRAMTHVMALGVFDTVDYQLFPGPDGRDLVVETRPRALGAQRIQMGVKMSTTFEGDARFGVLGRWSIKPRNPRGGELAVTAEVGTDIAFDVELVHYLGAAGRFFVEPGAAYAQRTIPVIVGDVRLAERRDESVDARLAFGRELGSWGLASVGVAARALDSDVRVGDALGLGAQSGTYVGVAGRLAADTLNAPVFPTSGVAANLSLSHLYETESEDDSPIVAATLAGADRLRGLGVFARYDGGVVDHDVIGWPTFQLGGFKRLSGFQDNSVPATAFHLLRLEAFHRLGGLDSASSLPIYLGATLEAAHIAIDIADTELDDDFFAGSLYGAINTPVGPAYVALGLGEEDRGAVYVYFGSAF